MKRPTVSAASTATSAQLVKSRDTGKLHCLSKAIAKSQPPVNGFTLTKDAIFAEGLDSRQKLVFIVISAHADNRGIAYPSLKTIAKIACIAYKRDRMIKIINELVAKGHLERKGFHGRNRQYRVIGHVPTASTHHKETRVPMSGACMCTHNGYTNIPNNIHAPCPKSSEQCTTPEGGTKNKDETRPTDDGCAISINPKIANERRGGIRRNTKREKLVARSNRLDRKISSYTSFVNRLPPGSESDGIKKRILKFEEEKAQMQKRLMSTGG